MDLTPPGATTSRTAGLLAQLAAQVTARGLHTTGCWPKGDLTEIAVCNPADPALGWAVIDGAGELTWERDCRLATAADIPAIAQVIAALLGPELSTALATPPPHPRPGPDQQTVSSPAGPNAALRAWRETNGLTRAQMAEALNGTPAAAHSDHFIWCHPATIAKWENGQVRWPTRKHRAALHDLTGQHPADLGFTAPTLRPRRKPSVSVTLKAPTAPRGGGEFAGYLNLAARSPAFRAACQDARTRSMLLEHLTALRTALGLTQAQVAERTLTTQSAISELENGGTDPQLSTLQRYARALGARLTITLTGPPALRQSPHGKESR